MNVKEQVLQIVTDFKTRNPFEIAEKFSIAVSFEDLGSVNGYYITAFGVKSIHINKNLSRRRQEVCCAHELGHAVMHENLNTFFLIEETLMSADKFERQANLFASYLLFPDEVFREYEGWSAEQIASDLGVPRRLIEIRIKN